METRSEEAAIYTAMKSLAELAAATHSVMSDSATPVSDKALVQSQVEPSMTVRPCCWTALRNAELSVVAAWPVGTRTANMIIVEIARASAPNAVRRPVRRRMPVEPVEPLETMGVPDPDMPMIVPFCTECPVRRTQRRRSVATSLR